MGIDKLISIAVVVVLAAVAIGHRPSASCRSCSVWSSKPRLGCFMTRGLRRGGIQ